MGRVDGTETQRDMTVDITTTPLTNRRPDGDRESSLHIVGRARSTPFLIKLWSMMHDRSTSHIIDWGM
jgi:hypothetical protein